MWYALVHDEQLGPMPDTELAELHGQGVISDETLVWTATMADWQPVREVPEIQLLLADPDLLDDEEAEGATMMMAPGDKDWAAILNEPSPEQPAVEPAPLDARTEMMSPDMLPAELTAMPADGLLAPQTPAGPPLPAFGADEPGTGSIIDKFPDAPPAPAAEPDEPEFAPVEPMPPPSQSGRSKAPLILLLLFLLVGGGVAAFFLMDPGSGGDAPQTDAPKANAPQTDAPKANAPQTDAPKANAPQTNAPQSNAPQTDAPQTTPSVAAATTPVKDAGVPDASPSDAMVIALADLEPESPPSAGAASTAPPSQAPGTATSQAPKAVPSDAPKTVPSAKPKAVTTSKPKPPKVAKPAKARPKSPRSRKPRATRETRNDKSNNADLPVQLSRSQITSVLRRSGGALRSCASLDEKVKEGTFSVNVVIKRSGVVHSAKVITARLRKSPAAKCIEGQVKRFRFGRFKGDPMRIQLPFRL